MNSKCYLSEVATFEEEAKYRKQSGGWKEVKTAEKKIHRQASRDADIQKDCSKTYRLFKDI